MVAIPINFAILLFTARGKDENGEIAYSETVDWILKGEDYRTLFEVALILALVEHLLLAIKLVVAQLIPDVPKDVILAERRRPKI